MALLAEQIVEEWLMRQGYFTIRGLKIGYDEIDLLAIKRLSNGNWFNLHVEVQVSIKPVSYITGLSSIRQKEYNIFGSGNAKKREPEMLENAVIDWIEKKFKSSKKHQLRIQLSGSDDWHYMFVHGAVKSIEELKYIHSFGVELKSIKEVINELSAEIPKYTTGSGTDIIDLIKLIS